MFLIHGVYKLFKKVTDYRVGWCMACKSITHAEKFKTWNFLHIFWIPLLPLGRHSKLLCTKCENDPLKATQESKILLSIGFVLFSLFAIIILFVDVPDKDINTKWVGFTIFIFLGIYCAYSIFIKKKEIIEKIQYNYPDNNCYYCKERLVFINGINNCEKCQVNRIE